MTTELYFIYDSHCPWSYAATPIANALQEAYPKMQVHLLHAAHYMGKDSAGEEQMEAAERSSGLKFGRDYIRYANSPKSSIKTANLMGWMQSKQADKQLPVLNALQRAHFIEGNPLNTKHDFMDIVEKFKLSPSNKIFRDELNMDAEYVLESIEEIQQMIGTKNFPAMVMTVGDNAIFIDHSKYISSPHAVVDAVKQEIAAFK
ncbi:protein-disulfide isomerase [Shewanella sp. 1_MG-2023]|uniref:protein-disulfide isomerase n=1 Tax=unclassified Shewanella TaxID=196818 RepID=UPI0026E2499E|nr:MULTISPECIES: protein-disulfide isomerase [unclassified Shewanella]MDO6611334.1 protein-disulfide isomerase [Shewanella sp. 7_MG-2023]MDO6771189.1 protein-disulfide isomerase [Shewanella sp. 2_MG-2023]MDO6795870.1 protein-disulfide isomerase [Shewanella sp. 1_MG-2023]